MIASAAVSNTLAARRSLSSAVTRSVISWTKPSYHFSVPSPARTERAFSLIQIWLPSLR